MQGTSLSRTSLMQWMFSLSESRYKDHFVVLTVMYSHMPQRNTEHPWACLPVSWTTVFSAHVATSTLWFSKCHKYTNIQPVLFQAAWRMLTWKRPAIRANSLLSKEWSLESDKKCLTLTLLAAGNRAKFLCTSSLLRIRPMYSPSSSRFGYKPIRVRTNICSMVNCLKRTPLQLRLAKNHKGRFVRHECESFYFHDWRTFAPRFLIAIFHPLTTLAVIKKHCKFIPNSQWLSMRTATKITLWTTMFENFCPTLQPFSTVSNWATHHYGPSQFFCQHSRNYFQHQSQLWY